MRPASSWLPRETVADRNTWDFALVNVAAAFRIDDGVFQDARIVCGGVECVPRRMRGVEDLVVTNEQSEDTAALAASLAPRGARTLNYNHFKVPLMENLVKRAIRDA